jgi:cell division protein FtsL
MLVNRKQQSDIYQQPASIPVARPLPKLDIALRGKCLITVLLVAAVAVVVTVRSESIIRSGYELVQMKSQSLSLQKENELLRLDIAKLKSPQRIQGIATVELGMVIPQHVYYAESFPENEQTDTRKDKNVVSNVANKLTMSSGQ